MASTSLLLLIAYIFTAYTIAKWVYRLFLSPISHFPGPRLAALTYWYEGYYDIILRGRYTWRIKAMHERYGPVVRINPCELHVVDKEMYHDIYVGNARRTDKWDWSARMFGTRDAVVGTTDHGLHHLRKQALAPFFSKASVSKMEPVICDKVDKLRRRLLSYRAAGKEANMSDAFTAFSADVIGSCVFGLEYGFLDTPDFAPEWREAMVELSRSTHLMKQVGWASPLLNGIVDSWIGATVGAAVYRPVGYLCKIRHTTREAIEQAKHRTAGTSSEKDDINSNDDKSQHAGSVLESLISSSTHQLPTSEMTTPRLMDECITLLGAGSVTTAQALTIALYFILAKPSIESQLRSELSDLYASTANPTWSRLSQLPYLTAILNEALRLSYGVASRLPRVSPDTDLVLPDGKTIIPRGTPVSMTQMFIHDDPLIFTDPLNFDPERWLRSSESESEGDSNKQQTKGDASDVAKMRKFLVPFSRGTRACLGTNLAWAELYCCIAGLFRPPRGNGNGNGTDDGGHEQAEPEDGELEMRLHATQEREIRVERDYFNGQPGDGCRGVCVLVQ